MKQHDYTVDLHWRTDRRGILSSPDILATASNVGYIEVATPPQFPKGIDGLWSPEHLFTAAVNSCFMTTFLSIAENSQLKFQSFFCASTGRLEQMDGKFIMTCIQLDPLLVIYDESDREKALRVLNKSEAACLIANSIKSKVEMHPVIEVAFINSISPG